MEAVAERGGAFSRQRPSHHRASVAIIIVGSIRAIPISVGVSALIVVPIAVNAAVKSTAGYPLMVGAKATGDMATVVSRAGGKTSIRSREIG
jgi:H+/gluconate symporter-like permease